MPGKARPSLRKKTLLNVLRSNLSIADKKCVGEVFKAFEELISAQKQKHGKWELHSDENEICASEFVCSNCKESFCTSELTDEEFFQMMKYCPNCGAKMDGGAEL